MNFSQPFLTEQLIAYIGNKRKLLPLIFSAIESTGLKIESGLKFLDVFSGSGAVSRLAKILGFELFTNDWEFYANILNRGYLETNNSEIAELFGSEEKFDLLLEKINSLPNPDESKQYIARFYAPREFDEDKADWRTERLFYTRKNALAIDKIRNYIEENFSNSPKIKNLLLANLLYESSTHTNTSGVFKAFHKGFGGHGKDALNRIFAQIRLNRPVLIDSDYPVHIFQENANELVRRIRGLDIAYLDPPYNQHQYGSNYHLLNTIAKWDKIPAPLDLNSKGELREKAAIRHDWVNTRSNYCYREFAENSFADLIENIDAKHILISYSTDGIIPFEKMRDICVKKGRLSIVTNEYTTYRGGKKSNSRKNTNIEFILCIDTSAKNDEMSLKKIDAVLAKKRALLLFKQKFCQKKLFSAIENFCPSENSILKSAEIAQSSEKKRSRKSEKSLFFKTKLSKIEIKTKSLFELVPPDEIAEFSTQILDEMHEILFPCACETKEDELAELFEKMQSENLPIRLLRKIPSTLKNLAHKKNRAIFEKWLRKIEELEKTNPADFAKIKEQIESVKRLAELRFSN